MIDAKKINEETAQAADVAMEKLHAELNRYFKSLDQYEPKEQCYRATAFMGRIYQTITHNFATPIAATYAYLNATDSKEGEFYLANTLESMGATLIAAFERQNLDIDAKLMEMWAKKVN